MKGTPEDSSRTLDRRELLAAGCAGFGTLALSGAGFGSAPHLAGAIQFESTPPAPPVMAPTVSAGETPADVAARLNYDAEAIFAFVRDEIHYESYAGVLRGARGTLWARAGNAADQAVLLGELLATAQIPHRFATGQLGPVQEAELAASLVRTSENVLDGYVNAIEAAVVHGLGLTDPAQLPTTLSAGEQEIMDRYQESSVVALDLARTATDVSTSIIMETLAGAGIDLPPLPEAVLPELERLQHAWVQVADGAGWIDLDPALAESEGAPVTAAMTMESMPGAWLHKIQIAIEGERLNGTALARTAVATLTSTSGMLAGVPVAIGMTPVDALASAGVAIGQLVEGRMAIHPWIYVNGDGDIATEPLLFTTDFESAAELLGTHTEGFPAGETIAVWMVVEITSPGAAPVRIERALLDRLPPEDRGLASVDPDRIAPLQVIGIGTDTATLAQLDALTLIHTDVARTPPSGALFQFAGDQVFGPVGTLGPSLAGLRDALGMESETASGHWSYPAAPNITAFHISSDDAGEAMIVSDLIHRQRAVLPLADGEPEAAVHPLVLAGVLNAVAEQALLAPGLPGEDTVATGPTIGAIFAAAADTGVPIRLLAAVDNLAGIDADPESARYLRAALEAGMYAIVPESPVELNGATALGWWIVDPITGQTRDQLHDGTAGASIGNLGRAGGAFYAPMLEYTRLINNIEAVLRAKALCFVGVATAFVGIRVALIFAWLRNDAASSMAMSGAGVGSGVLAVAC